MAVEVAPQQTGTIGDQVVDAFVAAWNTPDENARWRLLEQCWADDGTLLNRSREDKGRVEGGERHHVDSCELAERIPRDDQPRSGASRLAVLFLSDLPRRRLNVCGGHSRR